MKIHKLTIENIKRISAMEITPDGTLVILSGENEQGKSSVIDSISFGLGGAEALKSTPKPLKAGSETGKIIIELDDLIVTRWWTSEETSYLKVTTKDLASYPSPQALLEKLIGKLTFDPLEFMKLKEAERIDMLMNFIGKKEELTKLNIKYSDVYNERSLINKEFKKLQVYFNEIPTPADNLPEKQIDTDTFFEREKEAINQMHKLEALRTDYKAKAKMVIDVAQEIKALKEQIKIKEELIRVTNEAMEKLKVDAETIKPEDISIIKAEKAQAIELNNLIANRDLKYRVENEMGDKKVEADKLTTQLENILLRKKEIITEAKFPIEGLTFDNDVVLYNNIPFSQAADSVKLRVSFAIGVWMNPGLKIMMSKHGNDIGANNMKLLYEMAKESGFQFWLEKIREDQFPAIIIEDGAIKELSFPSVNNQSSKSKGKKNGNSTK